jgi:hypothetical protein
MQHIFSTVKTVAQNLVRHSCRWKNQTLMKNYVAVLPSVDIQNFSYFKFRKYSHNIVPIALYSVGRNFKLS